MVSSPGELPNVSQTQDSDAHSAIVDLAQEGVIPPA